MSSSNPEHQNPNQDHVNRQRSNPPVWSAPGRVSWRGGYPSLDAGWNRYPIFDKPVDGRLPDTFYDRPENGMFDATNIPSGVVQPCRTGGHG